jgi:hypothetical protein
MMEKPELVKLGTRLKQLNEKGVRYGIPIKDALEKANYGGGLDGFKNLVRSGNDNDLRIANYILKVWETMIRDRDAVLANSRGVSPKSVAPPKQLKLHPQSTSETLGLDDEGRRIVLGMPTTFVEPSTGRRPWLRPATSLWTSRSARIFCQIPASKRGAWDAT